MWYDEPIDTFGCDKTAICELLLLAQLSGAGYIEANLFINKLFKSKSDSKPIANYSAFMHIITPPVTPPVLLKATCFFNIRL